VTRALITGGAGFFGGVLAAHLRSAGWEIALLDRLGDAGMEQQFPLARADLTRPDEIEAAFAHLGKQEIVFHCAALMGHEFPDPNEVWRHNVEGTRNLAAAAVRHGVRKIVYTSSICVFGRGYDHPVTEDEPVNPIETYGKSKLEAERILLGPEASVPAAALRVPTIVSPGRLGLLTILFEFIAEGRRIYLVGGGRNRYQFVYAGDLAEACRLAALAPGSALYNVGADRVRPLREVYQAVIDHAGSRSRLVSLPRAATTGALRALYAMGVSPLGPYHYRMISESFIFDTTRIRNELGWRPTRTGEEVLCEAYEYWRENRAAIEAAARQDVSAHKRGSRMGVIRLVKWLS